MKHKYLILAFILVFSVHAFLTIFPRQKPSGAWVSFDQHKPSFFSEYLEQTDYLMSYSFGLAGSFTLFALLKTLERKKRAAVGAAGGASFVGFLYLGGCFLLGCCGSPLLAVYLSLFGTSFLGMTKFLVAGITTLSVILGYFWLSRKDKRECCNEKSRLTKANNNPAS